MIPESALDEIDKLNPREIEALQLIAEGLSNKRIADRMDISMHTAKFHCDNVIRKMKADNRTGAAVKAIRMGIIK